MARGEHSRQRCFSTPRSSPNVFSRAQKTGGNEVAVPSRCDKKQQPKFQTGEAPGQQPRDFSCSVSGLVRCCSSSRHLGSRVLPTGAFPIFCKKPSPVEMTTPSYIPLSSTDCVGPLTFTGAVDGRRKALQSVACGGTQRAYAGSLIYSLIRSSASADRSYAQTGPRSSCACRQNIEAR